MGGVEDEFKEMREMQKYGGRLDQSRWLTFLCHAAASILLNKSTDKGIGSGVVQASNQVPRLF
jgi:hypothetical protein